MVSRCLRSEIFVLRQNARTIGRYPWIITSTIRFARMYAKDSSSSSSTAAPTSSFGLPPSPSFSTPPTPSTPRNRPSKSTKNPGKQTATLEPSPIFASFNVPKFDPTKRTDGKTSTMQKKKQSQPLTTAQQKRRTNREEAKKARKPQDEKSYAYKSLLTKSSIKKLGNLTRQIAHKDLDHAITQMRFSPKRIAQTIRANLEHAKEEAIRLRGLQEGKIVVDQAWVGRGPFIPQLWPRARGRMNIRMRPRTSFTVVLRDGEAVEMKVKEKKMRRMWRAFKPMSDRKPIYNPRPYYTW